MHKSPPSALTWLVVFCAVISIWLTLWSKRLPEANWEKSTAVPQAALAINLPVSPTTEPSPETDSTPAETPAASPTTVSIAPAPTAAVETAAVPAPSASTVPTAAAETPASGPAPTASLAVATPDSPAPANPVPTTQPSPSVPPSDAALAGPLPEQPATGTTSASPSLQPIAAIAPAPLDITEIAKQPQLWPRQILLRSSVRFAVVIKGMNAGTIQVPAGRAVNLRKVESDGTVEIELPGSQGSLTKVKAQETDLVPRVSAAAAAREKASFGPPPALKAAAPSETIPTL